MLYLLTQARKQISSFCRFQIFYKNYHESWGKISKRKGTLVLHYQKWDAVRDTIDIMIASEETIVICNVQPYGRGVGDGEGGWEKVLSFLKNPQFFYAEKLIYCKK